MVITTSAKHKLRGMLHTALVALLGLTLLAACADSVPASGGGTPVAQVSAADGVVATFGLKSAMQGDRMVFLGVGGDIDGQINPVLRVSSVQRVRIELENGDASEHDIAVPDFNAESTHLWSIGEKTTLEFTADRLGEFDYYCTVAGHRAAGMAGKLVIGAAETTPQATAADITRDPSDLPGPLSSGPPQTVKVSLETVELEGRLADGATYRYMTFGGKVPGPFLRARVGDTIEVDLKNRADSHMTHSIDLHAVTGPGGGAGLMHVAPGQEKSFTFKALHAGLYVYHCATPLLAEHIASGMYGLILIEPQGGLPPVDREFYVMQGELYTVQPFGGQGQQERSAAKLLAEQPDYFVFNGAVGALTTQHPLRAAVGETIRIYFGVGGPNFSSSFHLVGAVFDRVYNLGSLTTAPLTDVQTVPVPPGGTAVVELTLAVPGSYMLMDHALSRAAHGLEGDLIVDGSANPQLFHAGGAP